MFEVKDMPDLRSNKVWDEKEAVVRIVLPGDVKNNKLGDNHNFFELTNKRMDKKTNKKMEGKTNEKTGEDAGQGSLAAAEVVQAATDERRSRQVTRSNTSKKKKHILF